MKTSNKIRLVLWGFVWLVILGATIVGIYSYFSGRGEYGKIRAELKPLINTFNNLENIKIYKGAGINIKANLKKDKIVVEYSVQKVSNYYEFEYKTIDTQKVLYLKYYSADAKSSELIISFMLNAIAVKNNHKENEIFDKFNFEDFQDLEINQGIKIIHQSNLTETYLNIDKTVLDSLSTEELYKRRIISSDLENINNLLKENANYTFTKDKYNLYVQNTDDKYIIYIRNGQYNKNLYESIKNVIYSLELDESIQNEFEINYPNISTSKSFNNYIITIDADTKSLKYFTEKDHVIKIEIVKEKTDSLVNLFD